jgi:hypothetical protein
MRNRNFFRSLFGIIPTFLAYSVLGCVVGHFVFGIPHGELGVVVSVPLTIGFLVSRIAESLIPSAPKEPLRHRTTLEWAMVGILVLGVFSSVVMIISAPIFVLIEEPSVALGSTYLAGGSFLISIAVFVIALLKAISRRIPLLRFVRVLAGLAIVAFGNWLQFETKLPGRRYASAA